MGFSARLYVLPTNRLVVSFWSSVDLSQAHISFCGPNLHVVFILPPPVAEDLLVFLLDLQTPNVFFYAKANLIGDAAEEFYSLRGIGAEPDDVAICADRIFLKPWMEEVGLSCYCCEIVEEQPELPVVYRRKHRNWIAI